MKNINLILFITGLLFTFSCKKIEPPIDPSEANDPIYLLEGLINGDSLKLYVNDTSVFISNAPHNMNGVEAYSSTISDIQTNFELKMIVLKPEIYLSASGIQAIKETSSNFIVHQPLCKSFIFSNSSNQSQYTKIVVNGSSFNGNEIEINEYGKYDLDFSFNNISNQTYTLPVEIGFKDEILNPYFDVTAFGNKIQFTSNSINTSNTWLMDGNQISTKLTDTTEVTNGIHTITHQVTDNFDNSATYSTLINFYDDLIWQISPEYCSNDVIENNYSNIIIEVMYNGEKYTSAYNTANLSKAFYITNIEYILDPQAQSISFVKLKVNFDVELKTLNDSKTLNLTNMQGIFHIKIN